MGAGFRPHSFLGSGRPQELTWAGRRLLGKGKSHRIGTRPMVSLIGKT